jgi:hypothetical protein
LVLGRRKMSKHTLVSGDAGKLLDLLARLKSRAEQRIAAPVKIVAIQEVGLDGVPLRFPGPSSRLCRTPP